MKGISGNKIKEEAIDKYKENYFSKSQLDNNTSWKK